jgi:PBSX family phage portal protein
MSKRMAEVELKREYQDNPTVADIKKRNIRAIKATIFGLDKIRKSEMSSRRKVRKSKSDLTGTGTSSGKQKEISTDPWMRLEKEGRIVPPPFDLLTLAVMPENNTELGPVIDAMSVNIESFGWRLEPRILVNEQTSIEILRTLAEEQVAVENFFTNCCTDGETFEEHREKLRKDLEATGNCYTEFIEIPGTEQLDGLNHLPSWTMRIAKIDDEVTPYVEKQVQKSVRFVELPEIEEENRVGLEDTPDLIKKSDGKLTKQMIEEQVTYELKEVIRFKKFRRYVQISEKQMVWFKELGDPRLISCKDGKVVTREQLLNEDRDAEDMFRFTLVDNSIVIKNGKIGFPVQLAANAVRHRKIYSTRSPYGLPRYTGHLFCIFGSRAAEEINFTTFKNNNVPSMFITVTNGQLTEESGERVEEFVEAAIQSDDNYSKFLLLEAEPVMEGMRDPGAMKIEVTPMTKEQHTDALLVNYQNSNDDRVRRAWRFPPIFVGKSEDFTGKTIEASRKLADEQVFQPERNKVDGFYTNDVLIRYLDIIWSTFKSMSPNVTENADLVKLLNQGEKTGSLTPRIGRQLMSRIVNQNLGDVDPTLLNPDQPFTLTLAQIMKSNSMSEAPGGGEPTSQGNSGLQVGGGGERDLDSEAATDPDAEGDFERNKTENLFYNLIRSEVKNRFSGFLPPSFEEDED